MIKFIHTCDVGGTRYKAGATTDETKLPSQWVEKALQHGYVESIGATSDTKSQEPSTPEENGTPAENTTDHAGDQS